MTYRLDRLYRLGAWGAAACMLAICAIVTFQVLLRCLDALLAAVGSAPLGLEIPGVSEMAAYLLVGATFLSMAYTFTHHAHIRVTLVISRLPPRARVWVETLCLLLTMALSMLLTWELVGLVRESINYEDVSSGLLSIPLWIPQSVLVVGIALMCLALIETLIGTLRIAFTAPASYVAPETDGDS
ncbi:TRAP transporter small permease [Chromohalobacter nigrandesensis]|uniref:TRAP transporter small permease n=1 Tax=Chromohalobacter nigrandesensis TaxID=119863 RepID=UPI001FF4C97E|nr:TRAP transporter small permease [Chromohalobacter nigrandesensis]MCK0744316.1 TRAP transporter small permease [Chromohalobacter nigrandesensis]